MDRIRRQTACLVNTRSTRRLDQVHGGGGVCVRTLGNETHCTTYSCCCCVPFEHLKIANYKLPNYQITQYQLASVCVFVFPFASNPLCGWWGREALVIHALVRTLVRTRAAYCRFPHTWFRLDTLLHLAMVKNGGRCCRWCARQQQPPRRQQQL